MAEDPVKKEAQAKQPKDYVYPKQRTDREENIGEAIRGLTPANAGWILAVVLIVAMIELSAYFENVSRSKTTATWLVDVNRTNSEQVRRCQETNKTIANALTRQTDRILTIFEDEKLLMSTLDTVNALLDRGAEERKQGREQETKDIEVADDTRQE